jgi:4'-phosphopantetheinyl transferase
MGVISNTTTQNCIIAIWEITETLEELLQLSNTISTADFNTKKRKKEWIASRLLLNEINPKYSISYNKFGAPELSNGRFISISHSKGLVAIIISQQKVGLDIEEISEKALRISSKFVSKNNLKALTAEKATLIWCCKEAVFKWYQKGEVDFIADIKLHPFESMEKGEIRAEFRNTQLILNYQKIHNHYLVYVCKYK